MSPAIAALVALLIAIVLSMISRLNVGLISIGLAWIVGVYVAGMKPDAVMAGFPATLFITLTGVTLLFACAEVNGTLERLAQQAVRLARGDGRFLPILFFVIAMIVSTIGPGAISSVALVAPLAMAIGNRAGLPHFLTALMVAIGACAGNLSPISSIGVIANTKMAEAGLGGHEAKVWFANFAANVVVGTAAYCLFGGLRRRPAVVASASIGEQPSLTRHQWLTCAVIALWISGVIAFKLSLGLSVFAAIAVLVLTGATDQNLAIRRVPWGVIVMVSGVSLLIALLEKTGGMERFTALLAQTASPASINGVIAFITGAISTYSSTSGVVLPAFLPTAPHLVEQIGGGDALAVSLSINVGSSLVDVSPLSTLGALCLATVNEPGESRVLFRQLLLWGLSMTVVGALICQLLAGAIARL